MTRRDWLLLLVARHADARGLEPVRVQKALFLHAREGGVPARERYWFVPYNYGPMSPRGSSWRATRRSSQSLRVMLATLRAPV